MHRLVPAAWFLLLAPLAACHLVLPFAPAHDAATPSNGREAGRDLPAAREPSVTPVDRSPLDRVGPAEALPVVDWRRDSPATPDHVVSPDTGTSKDKPVHDKASPDLCPSCGPGLVCKAGQCICDLATCPGCCDGQFTCRLPSAQDVMHCGPMHGKCSSCGLVAQCQKAICDTVGGTGCTTQVDVGAACSTGLAPKACETPMCYGDGSCQMVPLCAPCTQICTTARCANSSVDGAFCLIAGVGPGICSLYGICQPSVAP